MNKGKLLSALLATVLPLTALAQNNTWETNENLSSTQPQTVNNPDAKYLAGAVPEVNGRVVFSVTVKAPGKTARQIFDLMQKELERQATEAGQFDQSRLSFSDPEQLQLAGNYMEWLVFKSTALVLDRTRMMYHIIVNCRDGEADIKMQNINYLYEEERIPTAFKAEEWITDKWGLNKKKTKLARISGKFRRKTIDRKDYLFDRYQQVLNGK